MKHYENQKFRDRASELIIKSNLTQSELKEALGVSAGTISDLKNKKSPPPNAETLYKLAKYFNVSADYLLGLSDVPSVDIDLKAVCDYTGLSVKSIQLLNELKKYVIHDAAEILLGNIENLNFFAELSDMNWEIKEIVRIKKMIARIEEENADFIKRAGEREIPLEDLTDTEKKAFDEYYGLRGELMAHERERNLSLFELCKRIQTIASELEREGTASNENT